MLQAAANFSVAKGQERRRHSRVPLSLLGRYMLPNFREYPCQTRDLSPGGALIIAPVKAEIGQRVIVYRDRVQALPEAACAPGAERMDAVNALLGDAP